jgi:hypothetical protein
VNLQWLDRMESANTKEKAMQHHLFLVKLLHECGRLLTPVFMKKLKYPVNRDGSYDTPAEVGTIEPVGKGKKHSRGDAGYGAEDILSGGRMFHEIGREGRFHILCLTIQKKKQKTIYEISDKILKGNKMALAAYSPIDSHLTSSGSAGSIMKTKAALMFLPPIFLPPPPQGHHIHHVDVSYYGHKA